ncbi:hypothetical protein COS31_01650 [Candidatus Roizmanbacteria bacterium CG02_land_8_20_14_3_00_36_15]|uniref:Thymidylate kinase n=2 Tax=Candidatus Roizmaniibacteriota TaxID=1752723 RepID=A0A2M8GMU8_9BACT|nr:MAG: hypothetical protein COS51_04360 [Candidatus Roizmanbacteria bacterium CG03_land_8_20_14_0_80_36_21]PIV38008.1 MAG: hypothetical protein COS31_01650 [Candidatus Roizmanbacteria bacterium CG02_land_8_20_14_3_00_36_15]PJA52807.1 MAG: hypothetical protein CO166_04025 [Candidatus Roizmanbacteria bacterium CG_4_9_14_3_um_filter_36_11]PJC81848.1 MAG: hypothetical protein CO007_02525 [Candidatus Roizmanbacteria bacterium CG_4_8_14_3_um_filter_36_10]
MLNVYFTASTSHNGELIPYYKKILDYIKKNHVNVVSGDQVAIKSVLENDKKLTPEEIYVRERHLIDEADIVIAEASKPSLGVGSEIVYALAANKPVLVLVKTGYQDKISPIVAGNPSENLFLEYYQLDTVLPLIKKFINNIKVFLKHRNLLKKRRGKLIVIDGNDGSGKTTQSRLLLEYFKKHNRPIRYMDFPQYYNSFHGKIVARFLRGEFGAFDQVSPYLASLAFALDRASVKKEMDDFLNKGGLIITNRYATSNLAHQGAKFKDKKKRQEFLEWLYELEYTIHKIPKENLVIYLHVPWKISLNLTKKKGDRAYLRGEELDIAEKNIHHRIASEEMYLELVKKYRHWVKVDCSLADKILPPQIIHQKILSILKAKKYLS